MIFEGAKDMDLDVDRLGLSGAISAPRDAAAAARRARRWADWLVGLMLWLALLGCGWAVLVVGP